MSEIISINDVFPREILARILAEAVRDDPVRAATVLYNVCRAWRKALREDVRDAALSAGGCKWEYRLSDFVNRFRSVRELDTNMLKHRYRTKEDNVMGPGSQLSLKSYTGQEMVRPQSIDIQQLARAAPNLTHVNFKLTEITDNDLETLVKYCHYITHINLAGCYKITEKGVQTVVKAYGAHRLFDNYPGLQSLAVTNFLPHVWQEIIVGCPNLKSLPLRGVLHLEILLRAMAAELPKLTEISFSECNLQNCDAPFAALAPAATSLFLEGNDNVTFNMLRGFINGSHNLKMFNVSVGSYFVPFNNSFSELLQILMEQRLDLQEFVYKNYSMDYSCSGEGFPIEMWIAFVTGCTDLRIIEIGNVVISDNTIAHLVEKCSHLTKITLLVESISPGTLMDLLKQCPNLSELSLKLHDIPGRTKNASEEAFPYSVIEKYGTRLKKVKLVDFLRPTEMEKQGITENCRELIEFLY